MKFYNPFKWHIVEYRGQYAVRKFSILFGFVFKDLLIDHNWTKHKNWHLKYCFTDYENAKELLKSDYKFVEQ
jgi:hypothetical protein